MEEVLFFFFLRPLIYKVKESCSFLKCTDLAAQSWIRMVGVEEAIVSKLINIQLCCSTHCIRNPP